ncbi:MAG TPA: hypothetical protein VK939_07230 [Longimicrobiales bacterium]|nr:hypothetical protein [Longimicrobiales bacterium]
MEAWATMPSGEPSQQLGEELERLPGVLAAAVWLDADGGLAQVRLHTQPHASASIIAHAATRVLEQRGYPVAPSALRVVPVASLGEASGGGTPGRFLVLHDVTWGRDGSRITCRVRLARGADIIAGEASELDSEAGRSRAAAIATLRAAEHTLEDLALGLEGIAVVPLFGRRYMAVSIEAAVNRRFAQLSGMVAIEPARSIDEAACLATLRAIDRWIAV